MKSVKKNLNSFKDINKIWRDIAESRLDALEKRINELSYKMGGDMVFYRSIPQSIYRHYCWLLGNGSARKLRRAWMYIVKKYSIVMGGGEWRMAGTKSPLYMDCTHPALWRREET